MAALTPIFVNGWKSTVQAGSSAIGSSTATGINVASGDGAALGTIGTNQFVPMVVVDSSGTIKEYVWATARSTDALTVTRQAEDSSRFAASTTSIQSGYSIYAIASRTALSEWVPSFGSVALPRSASPAILAWSYDPMLHNNSVTQMANSRAYYIKVQVPVTISVSNILAYVGSAGATLTSGQNVAGIYDSSRNLLAQTADQSTAWTSTGLKTMALSGGAITVTGGPDVYVYVALLSVGTTRPAFVMSAADTGAFLLALQTAGNYRVDYQLSLTSLPSTATFGGGTTNYYWVGLS